MKTFNPRMLLICALAVLVQACASSPTRKPLDVGVVVEAPKAQRLDPPQTQAPPSYNFPDRLATIFGSSPPTPKASK